MKASLDLLHNLNETDLQEIDTPKLRKFLQQFETDYSLIKVEGAFDAEKIGEKWGEEILKQANHKVICQKSLDKIMEIYDLLEQKGSQAANLFQLYTAISTAIPLIKEKKEKKEIIETLQEYKEHLQEKAIKKGLNFDSKGESLELPENLSGYQLKLKERYDAIKEACQIATSSEGNTLNSEDKEKIKKCFKKCTENRPDWSERPFLQKLTDVLSFGMKPLFRGFFSNEKTKIKNLNDNFPSRAP